MNVKVLLLGAAACVWLGAPAFAQTAGDPAPPKKHHHASALEDRLNRMERIIEEQQSEIRDLKARVGQANASGGASTTAAATPAQPAPQPEVSAADFQALQNQVYEQAAENKGQAAVTIKKGRPTIATRDGKYSMSFISLVQADAATFDNSEVTGPKGTPVPTRSGFNFRRAQIGVQGSIAGDFNYQFVYDFGGAGGQESGAESIITSVTPPVVAVNPSEGRVKSAFVSYRGILDPFIFKIGAFPTPANLADATDSADLLLNERPSPAQLSRGLDADDGRDSVGFQGNGDIWFFSSYLTSDTFGKGQIAGQEAYVGRLAIAPVQDPDTNFNVHLGANLGYVFHPEGVNPNFCTTTAPACYLVSFSDRPELREWNVSWISTGSISATSAHSAGLEGAVSWGPLLLEGENFWYGINRRDPSAGQTNPNFSGWYVQGSWVFTGERRMYNMASAAFTRPTPAADFDPFHGNWGTWEVAARYSDTDLNYDVNSLVTADQVKGGDQKIYSAGLNFYPNYNVKFMFDWQNVNIDRPWSGAFNTKYNAFSLRAQVSL
ncbi:MAG TPA: porin [Rhizomicrobium sp.]|jgi:phosphate-selective porin OprO/OprP|nr:porin [Rhizomicrobium sp.]